MAIGAISPSKVQSSAGNARAKGALQSLNVLMADMQAGIGPFLGVFLRRHGWTSGPIGTVMASFLLLIAQSGLVVTVSQAATAIPGAAIRPAVTGMTSPRLPLRTTGRLRR